MHQNKGKSIADCLADRTDYAKNPDKTNEGEHISSYECDPKTIIENPKRGKSHYGKWLGDKKQLSHSERLRQIIDEILAKKPVDFTVFLEEIKQSGYEIKQGSHLSFKGENQKKFIRLRSLGNDYSEEEIKSIISGEKSQTNKKRSSQKPQPRVNLLVDIQAKLQAGKGAGYEQWAKIFNLKQMAQTINFLTGNNLLAYEQSCNRTI